jgi:hypothetical protein
LWKRRVPFKIATWNIDRVFKNWPRKCTPFPTFTHDNYDRFEVIGDGQKKAYKTMGKKKEQIYGRIMFAKDPKWCKIPSSIQVRSRLGKKKVINNVKTISV